MNIGRTLFWFRDGDQELIELNDSYFAFGILLNRLLNEHYIGRKIKFINIYFSTQKVYDLYGSESKNSAYSYGGHVRFDGIIDINEFRTLTEDEQRHFIWNMVYKYLLLIAEKTKNNDLLYASEYAYNKGLDIGLNPDYRMVESEIVLYGIWLKASIWVNFRKDWMSSTLTLEDNGKVIFEKELYKCQNGVELFLEVYKAILSDGEAITIKGSEDVGLPLTIPIERHLLDFK